MNGITYPNRGARLSGSQNGRSRRTAQGRGAGNAEQGLRTPNKTSANLDLMESLILQKFTRHPDLREKLLATGEAELIEGDTWWCEKSSANQPRYDNPITPP